MEKNLNFVGLIVMENKLKPETTPVINELREANIRCIMVTGVFKWVFGVILDIRVCYLICKLYIFTKVYFETFINSHMHIKKKNKKMS